MVAAGHGRAGRSGPCRPSSSLVQALLALPLGRLGRSLGTQRPVVALGGACFGLFAVATLIFSRTPLGCWAAAVAAGRRLRRGPARPGGEFQIERRRRLSRRPTAAFANVTASTPPRRPSASCSMRTHRRLVAIIVWPARRRWHRRPSPRRSAATPNDLRRDHWWRGVRRCSPRRSSCIQQRTLAARSREIRRPRILKNHGCIIHGRRARGSEVIIEVAPPDLVLPHKHRSVTAASKSGAYKWSVWKSPVCRVQSSGEEPAPPRHRTASRRWRGGRRDDAATRRGNFDFTQKANALRAPRDGSCGGAVWNVQPSWAVQSPTSNDATLVMAYLAAINGP